MHRLIRHPTLKATALPLQREEDTLAGALGPQDSAASTSESESHFTSAPQPPPAAADATPPAVTEPSQAPPLVDAPRREHELLPQFEPAETAFAAAKVRPQVQWQYILLLNAGGCTYPEHKLLPQFSARRDGLCRRQGAHPHRRRPCTSDSNILVPIACQHAPPRAKAPAEVQAHRDGFAAAQVGLGFCIET